MKILNRTEGPTVRCTVYELDTPLPFEKFNKQTGQYEPSGHTMYVCVSWGMAGDTIIFPSDERGGILDFMPITPVVEWDFWKDHDEAMSVLLESLTVAAASGEEAK